MKRKRYIHILYHGGKLKKEESILEVRESCVIIKL